VFGLQGRALTSAKRLALRRADAVTCNSSVTERAIQDIAPGLTLHRIPMGVRASFAADPELTRRLRARLRRGDGPLLAFVGRVVEEKGYADFLAALQQVAERHPDATGVVVGEGQDRAAAERLASDLGVESRVHFAGWVDAADVPSYLAASDVFLAPSRRASDGWIEAQGLTVIEAMLAGVPVVASMSGGIVDTIDDGLTGLLVPERAPDALAAAVDRIADDAGLRDRLVTEARRSAAERFSLSATADAFDELFRTVIGERRARLRRTGAA